MPLIAEEQESQLPDADLFEGPEDDFDHDQDLGIDQYSDDQPHKDDPVENLPPTQQDSLQARVEDTQFTSSVAGAQDSFRSIIDDTQYVPLEADTQAITQATTQAADQAVTQAGDQQIAELFNIDDAAEQSPNKPAVRSVVEPASDSAPSGPFTAFIRSIEPVSEDPGAGFKYGRAEPKHLNLRVPLKHTDRVNEPNNTSKSINGSVQNAIHSNEPFKPKAVPMVAEAAPSNRVERGTYVSQPTEPAPASSLNPASSNRDPATNASREMISVKAQRTLPHSTHDARHVPESAVNPTTHDFVLRTKLRQAPVPFIDTPVDAPAAIPLQARTIDTEVLHRVDSIAQSLSGGNPKAPSRPIQSGREGQRTNSKGNRPRIRQPFPEAATPPAHRIRLSINKLPATVPNSGRFITAGAANNQVDENSANTVLMSAAAGIISDQDDHIQFVRYAAEDSRNEYHQQSKQLEETSHMPSDHGASNSALEIKRAQLEPAQHLPTLNPTSRQHTEDHHEQHASRLIQDHTGRPGTRSDLVARENNALAPEARDQRSKATSVPSLQEPGSPDSHTLYAFVSPNGHSGRGVQPPTYEPPRVLSRAESVARPDSRRSNQGKTMTRPFASGMLGPQSSFETSRLADASTRITKSISKRNNTADAVPKDVKATQQLQSNPKSTVMSYKEFLEQGAQYIQAIEKNEEQLVLIESQTLEISRLKETSESTQQRLQTLQSEKESLNRKIQKYEELSSKYRNHINEVVKSQKFLTKQAHDLKQVSSEAVAAQKNKEATLKKIQSAIEDARSLRVPAEQFAALLDENTKLVEENKLLQNTNKAQKDNLEAAEKSDNLLQETMNKTLLELQRESAKSQKLVDQLEHQRNSHKELVELVKQLPNGILSELEKKDCCLTRILSSINQSHVKIDHVASLVGSLKSQEHDEPPASLVKLIEDLFSRFENETHATGTESSSFQKSIAKAIEELKEALNRLRLEKEAEARSRDQITDLQHTKEALIAEKTASERELQSATQQAEELRRDLSDCRGQLRTREDELVTARAIPPHDPRLDTKVQELESAKYKLERQLERATQEVVRTKDGTKDEMKLLRETVQRKEQQIKGLEQKFNDFQKKIKAFNSERETYMSAKEQENKLTCQDLTRKAETQKATMKMKLESEVRNIEQRYKEKDEELNSIKEQLQRLQTERDVANKDVAGIQEERIRYVEATKLQVERVRQLGQALPYATVIDDIHNGLRTVTSDSNEHRSTFETMRAEQVQIADVATRKQAEMVASIKMDLLAMANSKISGQMAAPLSKLEIPYSRQTQQYQTRGSNDSNRACDPPFVQPKGPSSGTAKQIPNDKPIRASPLHNDSAEEEVSPGRNPANGYIGTPEITLDQELKNQEAQVDSYRRNPRRTSSIRFQSTEALQSSGGSKPNPGPIPRSTTVQPNSPMPSRESSGYPAANRQPQYIDPRDIATNRASTATTPSMYGGRHLFNQGTPSKHTIKAFSEITTPSRDSASLSDLSLMFPDSASARKETLERARSNTAVDANSTFKNNSGVVSGEDANSSDFRRTLSAVSTNTAKLSWKETKGLKSIMKKTTQKSLDGTAKKSEFGTGVAHPKNQMAPGTESTMTPRRLRRPEDMRGVRSGGLVSSNAVAAATTAQYIQQTGRPTSPLQGPPSRKRSSLSMVGMGPSRNQKIRRTSRMPAKSARHEIPDSQDKF